MADADKGAAAALLLADGADALDSEHGAGDGVLQTKVYRRRWWVLFWFSMFSFLQGWLWGIPGPIADTVQDVFNIDGNTVQLLLNWGPIAFLPFMLPFGYWLDRPGGLRWATVFSMALVTAGAAIRCFVFSPSPASVGLLHVSYILNDIAGPVSMGAVSVLAERFFPVSQRATATALAAEANILGGAASFVIGPLMVGSSGANVAGLKAYMYVCCGICVVTLVAMIAYFPSAPPLPPSRTAHDAAGESAHFNWATFVRALRSMVTNRDFVVLALAYGLGGGMSSGWSSTLDLNLSALGYDQSQAGWIGFAGVVIGNVAGVLMGEFADRFRGHRKILVTANAASAACAVWFALMMMRAWPGTYGTSGFVQLFAAATLLQVFVNMTIPIFFELAMEATYPLPQGTTLMVLTGVNNLGSLIILFVPVQSAGAMFNWLFAGTCVGLAAMLFFFARDSATRYQLDVVGTDDGEDDDGEVGAATKAAAGEDPLLAS